MPRADNIFALQPAFAERSAHVIARIGKNAKCTIFVGNGELSIRHGDTLERRRRKLVDAADIDPVLHEAVLPSRERTICSSKSVLAKSTGDGGPDQLFGPLRGGRGVSTRCETRQRPTPTSRKTIRSPNMFGPRAVRRSPACELFGHTDRS